MRKKYRNLSVIALYSVCIVIFILFFLFRVENTFLFLILTVGSVAVLSTSTIYTVIQSKGSWEGNIKKKKHLPELKSPKKKSLKIIEDYIAAIPSIEEYAESDDSHEDFPIIDKYIFTIFSQEELNNINLLGLSKLDKVLFIREMLYFDENERKQLIDNMLRNRDKIDEEVNYIPPTKPYVIENQIRVYVRSLIEPGEKTKIIIIDTGDLISSVKKNIGILFDYNLDNFLLSLGGILLQENLQIKDYNADDDDEIALIPSRK